MLADAARLDFEEIGKVAAHDELEPAVRWGLAEVPQRDVFAHALAEFATTYADQNERDHAALARAVEEGRVAAHVGI